MKTAGVRHVLEDNIFRYPLFVRGDFDGFIGLFIDNLINLLIITAQAFQTTAKEHAPAVALGLMPAIAAWGLSLLRRFAGARGIAPGEIDGSIAQSLPDMRGILSFSEGALFSAMFLTAVAVYLIEKDFLKAFFWTLPLIVFSYFGFIHSARIGIGMAGTIPLGYGLFSLMIFLMYVYQKNRRLE